ncbi:S8/S53 family peptidase [Chryseobacterium sp. MEBOG06]|uniref:S8 family peptidase n=1 Tax=Chryseobacterium sp. MEBOG06 TaxID=2879938 RepID=UPI001F330AA3|nr:S8/S53 family peptidase [Chryseobacterium sp. MEBOG06]UKB84718.1 S8/S53 family peptidase [Chryseobacterium sp. MEBOG06]
MKIAIVDTGVDRFHSRLNNCFIEGITIYEDETGSIHLIKNEFDDNDGHGTGIASIIHKHIPEAALYVVKLSSYHENKSENLLINAISHIVEHYQVDIINISMGINSDTISNELEKVCKAAFDKNMFICASSFYFAEKPCYPAHFNTVIGVGTGIIKDKTHFRYLKNNPTNILAKGGLQRVANKNNSFKFGSGTSLATAHFTGILANVLKNGEVNSVEEYVTWCEENSNDSILSFNRKNSDTEREVHSISSQLIKEDTINSILKAYKLPSDVKNIALFPFEEKEMRSIVEFRDMLSCNISLIIGYPRAIKMDHIFSALKISTFLLPINT